MPFADEETDLQLERLDQVDEHGNVTIPGWKYDNYSDFFAAKEQVLRPAISLFEAYSDLISDAYDQVTLPYIPRFQIPLL
jgi:hypothetical protein